MVQAENLDNIPTLTISGANFINPITKYNVNFRCINFSGISKLPKGWSSHVKDGVYDYEKISFVDRPIPLDEADTHLSRLSYWGFTVLRLLVVWEALEPLGPGHYDEEFIDYLVKLIKIIQKHNMKAFIDPHQDTWSRLSGGSGHPPWTLYLAGLNPKNFEPTLAALTHFQYNDKPLSFPKMVWSTNYERFASATMFTLFFAGELYAPKCTLKLNDKEVNIQEFLQYHYIESYVHLAKRFLAEGLLGDTVIGFETMNEPNYGYIGYDTKLDQYRTNGMSMGRMGDSPKCFEAMKLGMGIETEIGVWKLGWFGVTEDHKRKVNPNGAKAWITKADIPDSIKFNDWQEWQIDGKCIWAQHGVWDIETQKLLEPYYFKNIPNTDRQPDIVNECWKPYAIKHANAIRSVQNNLIIFWSPSVFEYPPEILPEEESVTNQLVYTPHWYDGLTLATQNFGWYNVDTLGVYRKKYSSILQALRFGLGSIRNLFVETIKLIHDETQQNFKNGIPIIIGETGIPYNLNNNKAFKTGDYSSQIIAMDSTLNAVEQPNVMSCIWNYSPLNSHDFGDFWNLEDLSIYCNEEDKPSSPDKSNTLWLNLIDRGGRALESVVRPYAAEIPGVVTKNYFQPEAISKKKGAEYEFSYRVNTQVATDELLCKIFIPVHHFPPTSGLKVEVTKGSFEIKEVDLILGDFNPNESAQLVKRFLIWKLKRNEVTDGEEVSIKLQRVSTL